MNRNYGNYSNEGRYSESRQTEGRGRRSGNTGGRRYQDEYEDDWQERQGFDDDFDEDQGGRQRRGSGRQGFASMDPETRRRIAARGGRSSQGGRGSSYYEDDFDDYDDYEGARFDDYEDDDDYSYSSRSHSPRGQYTQPDDHPQSRRRRTSGRQGFASMDPEKHRRISAKGGRASHSGSSSRR